MADTCKSKSKKSSGSGNKKGSKGNNANDVKEPVTARKPVWIDLLQTELVTVLTALEELENPLECEIWEEDWMSDSTTDESDDGVFLNSC